MGKEDDSAKIKVIKKFPLRFSLKGIWSFLGHIGFYRKFIKDIYNISNPQCKLLEKEVMFLFDDVSQHL